MPALGVLVVELALAPRYGFHRDELYFMSCARRLAWGYVDQPPLAPFLVWLGVRLPGGPLLGVRAIAALAGFAYPVLAALTARELRGGRAAQLMAATATAVSTTFLLNAHMLTTATFDVVAWGAILVLAARMLRTGDLRLWFPLGAVAGIGLNNNYRVAFLCLALVAGLLLTGQRRLLATPWLAAGGALALGLAAPTVAWQALHGWPALLWIEGLQAQNAAQNSPLTVVAGQFLNVNPLLAPVWLSGLYWLLRARTARPWRALGVTYFTALALLILLQGRPYYVGPLYLLLFAAAGVAAERHLHSGARRLRLAQAIAILLAVGVLTSPFALPVLPPRAIAGTPVEEVEPLVDMIGWERFVGSVERVQRELPPGQRANVVLFALNYSEAGALENLAGATSTETVVSGHNNWALWGPGTAAPSAVIAVGPTREQLARDFESVVSAAVVDNGTGVDNKLQGAVVYVATRPTRPWPRIWADYRHYGDHGAFFANTSDSEV